MQYIPYQTYWYSWCPQDPPLHILNVQMIPKMKSGSLCTHISYVKKDTPT